MTATMGHYCRICEQMRANEKFSRRGHRDHICQDCLRLPREDRDCIERMDELYGFLAQSHISQKNIHRLRVLADHTNESVRKTASLVLEIARVKPYKRRRWKFLAVNHPELFFRLRAIYGDDAPPEVLDWSVDLDNPS
jgi:hypothetical protein